MFDRVRVNAVHIAEIVVSGGFDFMLFRQFRNDFRKLMNFIGPDGEIEMRNCLQQFRAAALRHAAHDAEKQIRAILFQALQNAELADGFAFRLVAYAAGVQNDEIGGLFGLHDVVPVGGEHRGGGVAVAFVHLAAVGFDVNVHELFLRVLEDRHIVAVNDFMVGVAAEDIMDFCTLAADQLHAVFRGEVDKPLADGFSVQGADFNHASAPE